ncbi:MAG: amidohydrolase [Lachnospiraceae bacterium]|nr:amidohydrolase [Lachnospiraceae bacterium]
MDILKEARSQLAYMTEQRRWFHVHPELSGKEDNTIAHIAEELDKLGIRNINVPKGGLLGFIDGAAAGPGSSSVVLLRADVDALPISESEYNLVRKRDCISAEKNVSHMCGHDGHMAMLLGAARILSQHKEEFSGQVILMFERGEEGFFNVAYLHKYMRDHSIEPDTCWGMHTYTPLKTGQIFIHSGAVMSGMIRFRIKLTGKGGHGARPDLANNPVDCFAAVYDGLSKLRLKCTSPFLPVTFSVGTVNSGIAGNVIPDDLTFAGTVRYFDMETARHFKAEMEKMIRGTAAAYGCSADMYITDPCYPVVNDAECAGLAKKAVTDVLGPDALAGTDPWMVSETVSMSLKLWPGVFALLGIRNEELGIGAENHSAQFDLDEEAFVYGAAATVSYALQFMRDPVNTGPRRWNGSLEELYESAGVDMNP